MPVLCLGLRIALAGGGMDGWAIRHLTITRFDTILIGAGLALAYLDDTLRDRVRRAAPFVLGGAILGLTVIWASLGRTSYDKYSLVVTLGFTCTALFGAALICVSLDHPVLDRAFLRTLGKYSYAIYIFHPGVNAGVHWLLVRGFPSLSTAVPRAVIQFGLTLGLSLAAAMISWSLWESKWLALKQRAAPARS
jgi:peptidoglycan/LPS O-acetylase OafA/YrhL